MITAMVRFCRIVLINYFGPCFFFWSEPTDLASWTRDCQISKGTTQSFHTYSSHLHCRILLSILLNLILIELLFLSLLGKIWLETNIHN